MSNDRLQTIERVGVPIGLVVTMMATAVYVTTTIGDRVKSIEHAVDMMRRDVNALALSVDRGVTQSQAAAWISIFRAANPTLQVPEMPNR